MLQVVVIRAVDALILPLSNLSLFLRSLKHGNDEVALIRHHSFVDKLFLVEFQEELAWLVALVDSLDH